MEKKLKHSENRNAILDALKNTKTHPTADQIYAMVKKDYPSVGIATIYRNLKILLSRKEIFKVDVGDGLDHYDAHTEIPHDHTYCTACGTIGDIKNVPMEFNQNFTDDEFLVEHSSLILFGKCKKCRQKEALSN